MTLLGNIAVLRKVRYSSNALFARSGPRTPQVTEKGYSCAGFMLHKGKYSTTAFHSDF